MILKLQDGKALNVKFWSFFKCYILSQLSVLGIVYAAALLINIILGP